MLKSFAISASGMTAERLRMDTIANNLANAETTRTPEGGPYRRQVPVFSSRLAASMTRRSAEGEFRGMGVRVVRIESSDAPPRLVYDPHHPDADENGYVAMPDVNVPREMVDLISASRAYEANVTAFNTAKNMAMRALDIGRR